jgi:hypothetical protein
MLGSSDIATACESWLTMIDVGSPKLANSGIAIQRLSTEPAKITSATLNPTM